MLRHGKEEDNNHQNKNREKEYENCRTRKKEPANPKHTHVKQTLHTEKSEPRNNNNYELTLEVWKSSNDRDVNDKTWIGWNRFPHVAFKHHPILTN
jgi:hypothetical protein